MQKREPEQDDAGSRQYPRDDTDRPFTPNERALLRELLTADQRRLWLVSTIKTASLWVVTVAAAAVLLQDYIRKLFHWSVP